MVEYAKFTGKMAKAQGFKHMLWNDYHVDKLIRNADMEMKGIQQTWEYIQQNKGIGSFAMKADFLRIILLYRFGGIYLDADVIVCGDLDFLVNTPNVVSFPLFHTFDHEIKQGMLSAPPKHRLMEMMLQRIISHGEKISGMHNLEAAGPMLMGRVADVYFKEQGINIPPLEEKDYRFNEEIDGVLIKDYHFNEVKDGDDISAMFDLKIADVRFGMTLRQNGLYHLAFKSWIPNHVRHMKCYDEPETIEPFFDYFCAHPQHRNTLIEKIDDFCGKSYTELMEELL